MGSNSSSSVEVRIYNKTKNITLKNPRTYLLHGRCTRRCQPELSRGGRDTCSFSGEPELGGALGITSVRGILVYDAESITFAVYFKNPSDVNHFSTMLGLELSPSKAHLGELETTYTRMAHGIYSSSDRDIEFTRNLVCESHETVQLSRGPIRVRATMSHGANSALKVVLEEQEEPMEATKTKKPQSVKRNKPGKMRVQFDIPVELLGKPGNAGELPENPAGANGTQ